NSTAPASGGTSFLDRSLVPLFLQSAMVGPVPKGVRPTVPIDLENSEPGAAAAYRMRQAVKPDFGRPAEGGEWLAKQTLMAGAGGAASLAARQAIAHAPWLTAGILSGLGLTAGTGEAGVADVPQNFGAGELPPPDPNLLAKKDALQTRMDAKQ